MGCINLTGIGKEAVYVDNKIKSGEVEMNLNSIDLSSYEEQVITHALNNVAHFRTKYGKYISDPGSLLSFRPNDLEEDYMSLRDSFISVEAIVTNHFDEYDEDTQNAFLQYQNHALDLDEYVEELLSNLKYRAAIKQALTAGMVGIQLIASLK